MKAIEQIKGTCIPVPIRDIDTDMILPAQYLTSTGNSGYGAFLFKRLKDQSEDFPLNNPKYQNASIIIAGDNFGCGSSREAAVWALRDAGIRAVIAPSFADIFKNNCGKNGILTIVLPADAIDNMITTATRTRLDMTIDLKALTIVTETIDSSSHAATFSFRYDEFRRHCLLNGLDDLDYLLSHMEKIRTYFSERRHS
jgi:3-isopropylmalate/(R)-2-methylmalate dehydratase small subunit